MRSDLPRMLIGGLSALGLVALLVYGVAYEIRHPCIEYRTDTCTESHCVQYMTPGDFTSMCLSWESTTYHCQTCVRRKP